MSPPQNDVIHRRLSPSSASLNVTTTTMDIGSSNVENCGFIIESSATTGGGDVVGNQEGGHDHVHHHHDHNSSTRRSNNNVGICRTSITILLWYTISNTAILSTKWLFNNHFSYPLTVTTYSNFTSFIWAALLTAIFPILRPIRPPSKHEIVHYIIPIGFFTALEIGCSNLALELLTVSFGTILKGSAPIFTFGFGLLIGVESFTLQIFGSLMLIAIGIILASLGEGHEFQLFGFILQLTGTALGGLRWAMTHKILQQDGDDSTSRDQPMSPLTATLYTAPMTAICVLPFAIGLEGTDVIKSNDFSIFVWLIMTGIATLVFLLLMSEYWLVKVTSSLALSVAGVFKELLTIGGGIFFFSDTIDWLNVIGFLMCQIGIVFYVCLRYEKSNNNNDGEGNYSSLSNNNNTTTTTTTTTINGTEDQSEQQDMFRDEEEEEITTLSSSSSKEKKEKEEEGIELPSTKHHYKDNNNFTINDDDDDDDYYDDNDDTGILT